MNAGLRFHEEAALTLVSRRSRMFLVRCPRCQECATVSRTGDTAKLVCTSCGLSKGSGSWQGPVLTVARSRCHGCGVHLQSPHRRRAEPPAKRTASLACKSCGRTTETQLRWFPDTRPGPFDPWFGLPLWLQTPCCGDVLWAWNRPHLELLRQYVTASLRERKPNVNSSFVSRLPRWLKAASNREEILRCIETLSGA